MAARVKEEPPFVVVDDENEAEAVGVTPSAQVAAKAAASQQSPRHFCSHCDLQLNSEALWESHLKSKKHAQRSGDNMFELDERNMYVDESTNAYKVVMGSKSQLVGGQFVVTEKGDGETKCILCKVKLKDAPAILDHLRSQKHVSAFVTRCFPDVYRAIQRKAKSKGETATLLTSYTDSLMRQFGKQQPLVHEAGYYDALTADGRRRVDADVADRRRLADEQKNFRYRSRSKERPAVAVAPPARRLSRSPHRRTRSPTRRRSRTPEHHHKYAACTAPSGRRALRRDENWRRQRRSRSPRRASRERRATPRSAGGSASRRRSPSVPMEIDLDQMDELPTEFDVFQTLCSAQMTRFEEHEKAYIQELIDYLDTPVLGVDYIAEYSDPRGQYEPGYLCTLCECRLNPPMAVTHAVSDRHTMAYLKKHWEKQYMALCIGTLGEDVRSQMKTRYLSEIAQTEGRSRITQKLLLSAEARQVFRHHKRVAAPFASGQSLPDTAELSTTPSTHLLAQQLVEMERHAPPFCEKNLAEGWYSLRKHSIDYCRRMMADPNGLFFSLRDPNCSKIDFYGDWNPQLMRRLQDKFNFKLNHIRWLQKLLTEWRVPVCTPLQLADLRPLEPEVESAVLNELVDQVLKPISTLRYMQVFEYEQYDSVSEEARRPAEAAMADLDSSVEALWPSASGRRDDSPGERRRRERQTAERALSAKEKALLNVIDQVLAKVQEGGRSRNAVMQVLVDFPNAREIMFRMATQQPAQLQHLVTIAKTPVLQLPPATIAELRHKLQEVAEEVRRDDAAGQQQRADDDMGDGGEASRQQKEKEVQERIDAARRKMITSKQRADPDAGGGGGLQVLTPKVPQVADAAAANAAAMSLPPGQFQQVVEQAFSNAMSQVVGRFGAPQFPYQQAGGAQGYMEQNFNPQAAVYAQQMGLMQRPAPPRPQMRGPRPMRRW